MSGVIVRSAVLLHAPTVIFHYGVRVFVRCLFARNGQTFLSIVFGG